ncbi:MAG: alpha/beta hydrolase [Akkermansiaceae bacterium]|nr:alpha/beta hydrolase [Akkermansiaceae bacterium]
MKALFLLFVAMATLTHAEPVTDKAISYYEGAALERADEYQKAQCKLDVRRPAGAKDLPVLIWFHGGGLTSGKRGFPALPDENVVVVTASYRFDPPGKFPCSLEDAAAATAWAFRHAAEYGGDREKIFISGHSAGGYLALMVGMDPKWLAAHQISNQSLAGIIPVSAQVTTHFHVKKLRGDTGEALRPLIDEFAPLYFASKNLPPICLITGDRKIEYKSRVEENDLFHITLKNLGHPDAEFHELAGFDHGTVGKGSMPAVAAFIKRVAAK